MNWIQRRFRFFAVGLLLGSTALRADVNLWVMSFDNLYSDSEIKWLKEGFVDFILDHYVNNSNVHAYKSEKLDETLSIIKKNAKYQDSQNLVLSGAFQRDKGVFIIDLQLTDLNTWEALASKQVREKSSDLAQVIITVNNALDEIVDPRVEKSPIETKKVKKAEQIVEPIDVAKDREMESAREMTVVTKNIGAALEQLLDNYSEKSKTDYKSPEPFQKNKFTQDAFTSKVKDFVHETHSFEQVVNRVLSDPYEINIGEPSIQRLPMNNESVSLSFRVDYKIKLNILKEMVETLKIKSKNDSKTFVEYSFSGNDYVFTTDFIRNVAYGEYRYFPVISLVDETGEAVTHIIDSPGSLNQIKHFNPMFNIAAGPWTMTVFLVKGVQEIDYELTLPIRTVARISQVTIDMKTEEEIMQLSGTKN
ncbi:hypothetical protein KJ762_13795 [bacterium]|nr:hypothetical protein [bacterium]MBU1635562.1 hypothetical protein [bacterium]MBU1874244.1 hypothetical protein [bacterium]